jgi:hypothetical protein
VVAAAGPVDGVCGATDAAHEALEAVDAAVAAKAADVEGTTSAPSALASAPHDPPAGTSTGAKARAASGNCAVRAPKGSAGTSNGANAPLARVICPTAEAPADVDATRPAGVDATAIVRPLRVAVPCLFMKTTPAPLGAPRRPPASSHRAKREAARGALFECSEGAMALAPSTVLFRRPS